MIIPFPAWLVNTDVIPFLCNHFCLLSVYIGLQIVSVGRGRGGTESLSQKLPGENKGKAEMLVL